MMAKRWLVGFAIIASAACSTETPPREREATPSRPAAAAPATTQSGQLPAPAAPEILPPLPLGAFPSPRPTDVVLAAYEFAARHPEVLRQVPCFCGCEHNGHRDNEDCFVQARAADGQVTWDEHGGT